MGLIYFIWNGIDADYWPRQRSNLVVMLIAAGAICPAAGASPGPVHYRSDALTVLAVLVIVFVGVILPGNRSLVE